MHNCLYIWGIALIIERSERWCDVGRGGKEECRLLLLFCVEINQTVSQG
jgi:hypothetical protein